MTKLKSQKRPTWFIDNKKNKTTDNKIEASHLFLGCRVLLEVSHSKYSASENNFSVAAIELIY